MTFSEKFNPMRVLTLLMLCEVITPLTDHRPPSVYLEGSSNVYVRAYKVVYLKCVSQPIDNVNYVWQKDGTDILVDSDSYTIRGNQLGVPADKTGTYRCLASNRFGTAVSNSTTILQADLKGRRSKQSITASKGASLHLRCDLSNIASVPPPVVTWSHQCPSTGKCPNNRLIKNSDERFTVFDGGSILVHELSDDDTASKGQFKCNIENKVVRKTILRTYEIVLDEKVVNLNTCIVSESRTVLVGNSAELYCICNTMKNVRLQWQKDGRYLANSTRLYIDNIKDSDRGQYTCQANHITLTTTLDVQSSPVIVDSYLVNDGVYKGDKVTFKCHVKGVPKPKVEWIINGEDFGKSELKGDEIKNGFQELTFEADQSCTVQCNVSNIHGYVIGSGYVMVMSQAQESSSTSSQVSSTARSVLWPSAAATTEHLPPDIVPDITQIPRRSVSSTASSLVSPLTAITNMFPSTDLNLSIVPEMAKASTSATTPNAETNPRGGLADFYIYIIIAVVVPTMVCGTIIIVVVKIYKYKKHALDRRTAASLSHIPSYIHGPMDPNEYIDRGSIFTDDSGFSCNRRIGEPRNAQEMVPLNTTESVNTQSASDIHIITNL